MSTSNSACLFIIRDAPSAVYDALSEEERTQSMRAWNAWVDSMKQQNKLLVANPLESTGRVVSGARGRKVTDGPYTEAKEIVGGFFVLVDVSLDEATAIAQSCPNLKHGMSVEVRPIAGACHVARSLGWETMQEPTGA